MKTSLKLILISLIAQAVAAKCDKGCLKCTPEDTCLFCNLKNSYILEGDKCVQKSMDYCEFLDMNGSCLVCSKDHYLEKTGDCLPVDAANVIHDCVFYRTSTQCYACEGGLSLKNNECREPVYEITRCISYDSDSYCIDCEMEFIPSMDFMECLPRPEIDGCLIFSPLECTHCDEGYIKNPNLYIDYLFRFTTPAKPGSTLEQLVMPIIPDHPMMITPCQEVIVDNCEELIDFQTCERCEKNFYLNDQNHCVKMPFPRIDDCQLYTSYQNCVRCNQGFLLANEKECKSVTAIENCSLYNPSSSANVCIECNPEFYLNGNTCLPRDISNSIVNCATFRVNADNCQECQSGYLVTTDYNLCLSVLDNCVTYNFSTAGSVQHSCLFCADGYFFDLTLGTCQPGSVTNCRKYQNSSNVCQICENQYYLQAQECIFQDSIVDCDLYNPVGIGCLSCTNTSYLFDQISGCSSIQMIENCLSYTDPITCSQCILGYNLTSNVCMAIPEIEQCQRKSGSTCVLCKEGFLLKGGSCMPTSQIRKDHCLERTGTSWDDFRCLKCEEFYYPIEMIWRFNCIEENVVSSEITLINHCIKYDKDNSTVNCMKCATGLYLSSDKQSCLEACPTNEAPLIIMEGGQEGWYFNICQTQPNDNCKYLSLNVNDVTDQVCVHCKPNTYTSNTGTFSRVYNFDIKDDDTSVDITTVNLFSQTFGKNCISFDGSQTFYPGASQPDPLCAYYTETNPAYCKACVFGKKAVYNEQGGIVYIDCLDEPIRGCDTKKNFGMTMYECNECYDEKEIPIYFKEQGYDLKLETPHDPTTQAEKMRCMRPVAQSFNMTPDIFSIKFVRNCGLAEFDVTSGVAKSFQTYSTGNFKCVHCRPGYKPVTENNVIVDCQEIINCDDDAKDKKFDMCTQCKPGFAFFYDKTQTNSEVTYDICVPQATPHCWVQNHMDPKNDASMVMYGKPCHFCKRGYVVTSDGICVKRKVNRCLKDRFGFYVNDGAMPTYFRFQQMVFGKGCDECEVGFLSYWDRQDTTSFVLCTWEDQAISYQTNYNRYIDFCQNYFKDSDVRCAECMKGYIPTTNQSACVSAESFRGCVSAAPSLNSCSICHPNLVLVDGHCEPPMIKQCKMYTNTGNSQVCIQCEDYFMLKDNICIPGDILNCQIYDFTAECVSCEHMYFLIFFASTRYCNPINNDLNCQAFNQSSINNSQLECTSCINGYAFTTDFTLIKQDVCMKIREIEFCSRYDTTSQLDSSTFMCSECDSNHFSKGYVCQERFKQDPQCKSYSISNDFCVLCNDGHFLSEDRECLPFPTGVRKCEDYINDSECSMCLPGYYLQNNSCIKVEASKEIPYCLKYQSLEVCAKCLIGFQVDELNGCKEMEAQNCREYSDEGSCVSCLEGYGLKEDINTGIINCVVIGIPNCRDSNNEYPFRCHSCERYFYPIDGKCFPILSLIRHCEVYHSEDECAQCEVGFILDKEGTYCIDHEEEEEDEDIRQKIEGCLRTRMHEEPFCTICEPGHYFEDGECYYCMEQSHEKGCLQCDPHDNSICLMCLPDYYQDKDGKCNSENPVDNGNNGGDGGDGSGTFRMSVFITFLALVVLN